jgi:23S rRNA (cytosine1962-C5)-methyltransferase
MSAGSRLALRITPPAERAMRAGHPWLFESSIASIRGASSTSDPSIAPGTVAVAFDRKNRFLGAGLWDPDSPIRVRVLVAGSPAPIGPELFRARIRGALERRRPLLIDPETTGIRLLHGEGDGLSGVVADLYGHHVVVKLYTRSWIPWLDPLLEALETELRDVWGLSLEGILIRGSRQVVSTPGVPAWLRTPHVHSGALPSGGGRASGGALPFLEGGLHFEAHPLVGHKTGFYLDQRENRTRVRSGGWAAGTYPRRVLNVFSYTGGFSLAAAAGGASEVSSLDISAQALEQASRHVELNRAHPAVARVRHTPLQGDAFSGMDSLARAGERFGLVIVDPPSFAKERAQSDLALRQYGRLTRLALRLLEPGGLLVQASCSSRVPSDDFYETIQESAHTAGRPLQEWERTGHPLDHPAPFPEGAYLKAVFAIVP